MNFRIHKNNEGLLMLLALFTCAILIHYGSGIWQYSRCAAVATLAVILQFINFRFWWATCMAIIASLWVSVIQFPHLPNHGNLEIFCSLIILFFLFRKILYNSETNYNTITLCFRYSLIATYFIAGFHKLNTGFFSEASCSIQINEKLNHFLFGDNYTVLPAVSAFSQYITIVIEMVVPFGLLFRRTRKITFLCLVVFHFYLSLCDFANFSAFAAFLLMGSVIDLRNFKVAPILPGLKLYQVFAVVSAVTAYGLERLHLVNAINIRFCNAIIFNIGWIIFFYYVFKLLSYNAQVVRKNLWPYIYVVVIVLWGMQAYIGMSNSGTLTMFSNLITEKSRNNHLIINTRYTKLFEFEEDYASVIEVSEDYKFMRRFDPRFDVPVSELKYYTRKWRNYFLKGAWIKIMYKGETIIIDAKTCDEFAKQEWWKYLLSYRTIPKPGVNVCTW